MSADDTQREGTESLTISIAAHSAYNVGSSNITITILDNDSAPEPFRLTLERFGTNFELAVNGPATRLVEAELGDRIETFTPLAPLLNATGTVRLVETLSTNQLQLFRAYMGQ